MCKQDIRTYMHVYVLLSHESRMISHNFNILLHIMILVELKPGDLVDGLQAHLRTHGKINARDIIHVSYQVHRSL